MMKCFNRRNVKQLIIVGYDACIHKIFKLSLQISDVLFSTKSLLIENSLRKFNVHFLTIKGRRSEVEIPRVSVHIIATYRIMKLL